MHSIHLTACLFVALHAPGAIGGDRPAKPAITPVPYGVVEGLRSAIAAPESVEFRDGPPGIERALHISEWTTLEVVALDAGPATDGALGYFTFDVDAQGRVLIESVGLIGERRASGDDDALRCGTRVSLRDADGKPRTFRRGERVGFFFENARSKPWRPGAAFEELARSGERLDPRSAAPLHRQTWTTLDAFNPEVGGEPAIGRAHARMFFAPPAANFGGGHPFVTVALETAWVSDSRPAEFDDLLFAVVASAPAALRECALPSIEPSDADGDGVDRLYDRFPDDADRVALRRTPASGFATLALEDGYPELGDLDYNDAWVLAAWTETLDADGRVRDLLVELELAARGSRHDHALHLRLPDALAGARGRVAVERFLPSTVGVAGAAVRSIDECRIETVGSDASRCLPPPFPSTRSALPIATISPREGEATRAAVDAASARVLLSFDESLDPSRLAPMPLEPFFRVQRAARPIDVHLPSGSATSGHPDAPGYVTRFGYPFLLYLPAEWSAPAEGVPVWDPYPAFRTWIGSRGRLANDWFARPAKDASSAKFAPRAWIVARPWTVRLP